MGRFPWKRKWQPTPVFSPGKFYGQRNLVGYSPRVANSHTHTYNMFTNKLGFFSINQMCNRLVKCTYLYSLYILKDDAGKELHSICQQIWKTQQWPQDWKRSVFIPIPKKGNAKECSNYPTSALISHTSKVMLKILQARLQQYVNRELPEVQAGPRDGRGTRDQIANIRWSIKIAIEFQKNIYLCFIDYAKAFDCIDHHRLKRWEYQTT